MTASPTVSMSVEDALRLRLAAQAITEPVDTPTEVAERLYAIQAQDVRAVRRAMALRTGLGDTPQGRLVVAAAFDSGEVVRSWPMRGTLFASTPAALAVLLSLTAERIGAELARRRERLGISDETMKEAFEIASEAVAIGPISRAGLLERWTDAGVACDGGLGYHMIVQLALDGVVVWGPVDGAGHLLVPGSPPAVPDDLDAVLGRAVLGYLAGHGPATVADVAWWTKLPKGQIRRGVAAVPEKVVAIDVDGTEYLVTAERLDRLDDLARLDDTVRLLPAFDEWYLGYRDRSLTAIPELLDVIVPGRNGMFRPIIVVGARTVGTWRRTEDGAEVLDVVDRVTPAQRRSIDAAVDAVA